MAKHHITYTTGPDDRDLPGSTVETYAEEDKHDRSTTPNRTIDTIVFDLDRRGDTATLKIMPGGNDSVVNASPETARVVEHGREGRIFILSGDDEFKVVTQPDARPRAVESPFGADDLSNIHPDKFIRTRVVINFVAGLPRGRPRND